MSNKLQVVLAELVAGLNREDLKSLQAQVDFRAATDRAYSDDEVLVWEALCEVMVAPWPRTLDLFCEGFGVRKYREAARYTCQVVLGKNAPTQRTPRFMMLTLALECLVEYMPPRRPRTPKHVMEMVGYLPQALERAYPGYLDAGLLHKIVRVAA